MAANSFQVAIVETMQHSDSMSACAWIFRLVYAIMDG